MNSSVEPFRIETSEAELADLRDRLRRTRWPDAETVDDWSQGMPLGYLKELCTYWAGDYDWRRAEQRINAIPQFKTRIDGLGIHFLHVRSPHPGAFPLVITHGWPGSVVEFLKILGPLTDPVAHGGDPSDAFDIVCPSLPGFGYSEKPATAGWGVDRIAAAWSQLMDRLGYERYGAQGGDWGAVITTCMGQHETERLAGIHVNFPLVAPSLLIMEDLTAAENAALASLAHWQAEETGYSKQQSTRPQTLGYGLVDSPAAQCAWIVEKFWACTDFARHLEDALSRDELLDNVMLYWLPATGASAARLYWESFESAFQHNADTVRVPAGCSLFPKEIFCASRRWAETRYTDLRYWNELDRGGHFAAFEQPELFVQEMRSFFRLVR